METMENNPSLLKPYPVYYNPQVLPSNAYSCTEYQMQFPAYTNFNQIQNRNSYYGVIPNQNTLGNNSQYGFITSQLPYNTVIYGNNNLPRIDNSFIYGNRQIYVIKPYAVPIMPNFNGSPNEVNVAGSVYNYVWPHYNDDPTHSCNTLAQYPQNRNANTGNKQVQAFNQVSNNAVSSNISEKLSSSDVKEKSGDLKSNNVETNTILTPSVDKRYDYKNSIINIDLFGIENKNTYISKEVYEVFYICDYPRNKVIHGITHIEVNFEDVKRVFTDILKLEIDHLDFDTEIKDSKISQSLSIRDVKKCDFWVKTNVNCKYIIQLSFINENKEERLRIRFSLKTEKKLQRKNAAKKEGKEKIKSMNEEEKESIKECAKEEEKVATKKNRKGCYNKENKIKMIKDLLVILKDNKWDLLEKCILSELEKDEKLKKDIQNLRKKLKNGKITEIGKEKTMKDVVEVVEKLDDIENKNNLLILCFDIIYKSIKNDAKNCMKMCNSQYKKFIKNYNIGFSRENDIIIMNDEKDNMDRENVQDKRKKIDEDDQNNKRKYPIEEDIYNIEPNGKRCKKNILGRDGSKQTNKDSEVEVLLVDR